MNEITIEKHFVVSIAHITEQDNDKLYDHCTDNNSYSYLCVYDHESGYVIHVPYDSFDDKEWNEFLQCMQRDKFSNTFMQLFDLAKQHDCCYITLDCDGTEYNFLPTYEW